MLFSMTGFGEAHYEDDRFRISVRMRAVNNKGLDVQLKLPAELTYLEERFRRIAKQHLFRGRIDVFHEFELKDASLAAPIEIDSVRLNQMIDLASRMVSLEGVQGKVDVNTLIQMPDLWVERKLGQSFPADMEEALCANFEACCGKLRASRAQEGRHLLDDILPRLQTLESEVARAETFVEERRDQLREAIVKRIDKLREDVKIDDNRIAQELVFYSDRLDVSEEITRLRAHLQTMRLKLKEDHSEGQPKGRELEFLLQEMFREITTLGNKVKLLDAAKIVVVMKTECEKIKEQLLNVE